MAGRGDRDGSDAEKRARTTDEVKRETTARSDHDVAQSAADLDQTHADSDQDASTADQAASDVDQELAERDQAASDVDQAAADREHSSAPKTTLASEAHEAARLERDAATRERDSTAAARSKTTARRLVTASRRDAVAGARDLAAQARDRSADARDAAAEARNRAAEARERQAVEAGNVDDALMSLRALRLAAEEIRKQSVAERALAAADREAAAADRVRAAVDSHDADLDDLTGVFRRGMGELALTGEIDRSRRSGQSLFVAFIDVNALKAVNDNEGHAAGDALLRDTAVAITSTLRSYDITVRWGGDEFVCAMSDVSLEVASDRLAGIQRAVQRFRPGASISAGIVELEDGDTLESLIARADLALYRVKASLDG
jgi:diguanylate cyclase (GGDEF)-like protein